MTDTSINTPNAATAKPFWKKAVGWAVILGLAYLLFFGIPGTGPATCESLVADVIEISEQNAGMLNAKVIDVVEIKTTSETDKELKCSGIGILSTGMKQNVTYRMYEEYDKWWVKLDPEGLPFE